MTSAGIDGTTGAASPVSTTQQPAAQAKQPQPTAAHLTPSQHVREACRWEPQPHSIPEELEPTAHLLKTGRINDLRRQWETHAATVLAECQKWRGPSNDAIAAADPRVACEQPVQAVAPTS